VARAAEHGIRTIHLLAWRDLDDPEAGGSELHMARVAAAWARAGLDVTVRTSAAAGRSPVARRDGYRVIRRAGRYAVFPDAAISESLRRDGAFDALVEAWNGVPFLTPLWFDGPRVALLHHVHRNLWTPTLGPRLGGIGRFVEANVAPLAYRTTKVVTLSESSRLDILTSLKLPERNVSVVPPGVEERWTPGPGRSPTPLVVAVGRLMSSKRFDALVRICDGVRDRFGDLELVIAGEGHERSTIERTIVELDASGWVHLPGRVTDDELLSLYRRAWVLAATSASEGWGMTLTEAAACGTPSVATDIPGHRDALAPGVGGLLAADPRSFGEQLSAIVADASLRARLSAGARRHAAGLTWDATAAGILDALTEQAGNRR
jgi:glycosyltransferase involved in cell wall biosynthesis